MHSSILDSHVSPSHLRRELAISAIGSAANAASEAIIPYFDDVMAHLKKYLALDSATCATAPICSGGDGQIEEKGCCRIRQQGMRLLTQSMETLGTLARAVGPASFAPALAEECCRLGLDLVARHDDPDVRKCAYALFGSVAFVVGSEMAPVLPKITEMLLRACTSKVRKKNLRRRSFTFKNLHQC